MSNEITAPVTKIENQITAPVTTGGRDAYQLALLGGFVGTRAEWLASLIGLQGMSAYQVALAEGFVGDVTAWLASLVGEQGEAGESIVSIVLSEADYLALSPEQQANPNIFYIIPTT